MTPTIIAHIFNEAYLLPWWLQHHVPLAHHGIIFDYASTDDSVTLCHRYAPGWDVRQSRNAMFDAVECDREVMDAEREVDGWKIVLNVTEFLVGELPNGNGCEEYVLGSRIMVDAEADREPDPRRLLVEQCRSGFYDHGGQRAGRLLHRHATGNYGTGRHDSRPPTTSQCEVWWYGWAPWTAAFRARKLQIQHRIPPHDVTSRLGWHHHVTEAALWDRYQQQVARL